jgi:non-specific protein-tyrosine kinase
MHAAERLPHVWLVTSPHPQDGKTTVAANLAVVMAQMGRRVLLVDADLRYPKLHNIFGYNASPGLSTCLQHDHFADSVIAPVLEPTLSLVPAGPCPPNPSELLGSEGMRRFIDLARACYDVIILDTPPLLAVSDALVASDLVDGVLLVLRSGATPRQHARRVLAQFAALHARAAIGNGGPEHGSASSKILGVVLNFLAPRQDNAYYADYRYYYARPAEAAAAVALPPAAR